MRLVAFTFGFVHPVDKEVVLRAASPRIQVFEVKRLPYAHPQAVKCAEFHMDDRVLETSVEVFLARMGVPRTARELPGGMNRRRPGHR